MPANSKSISAWVSCTGTSDDTAGAAAAFAAASHSAFTLLVDCPVNIKVGKDIARSIFIDNGTSVQFTSSGKFTVDNVFIPAFVIANSSNIVLTDWNVEYVGSLPVDPNTTYLNNGQVGSASKPGNAFNDVRLTGWLAANRAIVFDAGQGPVKSEWGGTTNVCAVFYLTGDTSNVTVTGMHLYVPPTAGGDHFIPVAFTVGMNFKSGQTVNAKTPTSGKYFALPHDLVFSNVHLDGTYMGWVGGLQDTVFENIQSDRYGDLQDAGGGTVGGVGKWFAPPHLFYFNYPVDGDPALFNSNIQIKNVVDNGLRTGKARDAAGTTAFSGYALSLKLGCVSCSVDSYISDRPDGLMDILTSDGLTVSNVTGTYDSSFTNNIYPGWRFPSPSYKNLTFTNVTLTDTAATTIEAPIGNAGQTSNQNLVFSNVDVVMNHWMGTNAPFPVFAGQGNVVSISYSSLSDLASFLKSQAGTLEVESKALPATLRVGQSTLLTWSSRQTTGCTANGAWSGAIGGSGSRSLKMTAAGTYTFGITCQSQGTTSGTSMIVTVTP